ncbi:methyltransferase family protein [Thiomonas intermedia]|uniref:methyltransferase family protein n=1 Tax=Thiomonas intermedia TaxID=926 RepID=UPI0009A52A77|nr:isoprenylcysteine carboxylmethyltransferase family protein [Thiomonas intermedia]
MIDRLEARVPPPLVMVATALLMWGAARWSPLFVLPQPERWALPTLLAILAIGVAGAGVLGFRRSATTIDPTNPAAASTLVTGGIYRYARNPMYLGLAGLLLSWALFLRAWWALPFPIAFVLYITVLQIIPEERALRAKFGADFTRYEAKVRRWL